MKKIQILTFLAIGCGGAIGTVFRYTINIQTVSLLFPLGTLLENLVGSLLLGFLTGWIVNMKLSDIVKTGLGVGFCGGFTTMSTLAADIYSLFIHSSPFLVILYMGTSIFGGVALAFLGFILGEHISLYYRNTKKEGEM
ncbi:hypothetical protein BKP45_09970 [Anaerobacillus alkalidiazotrophicus]|uniref:Fluoride-specific ion channel FluC n=1 Tax=Anaerobacillus alkalidiazotrophicus TaxID=472963 RepID=A0A1S2M6T9_9BACI|nr:CrcB family protein [Anaerobacillus alkalidiazotrophicus]OIJ20374.1 hypothetical protein BKP45_09970 [Anaerobacillus alkalidiazotrophicus]